LRVNDRTSINSFRIIKGISSGAYGRVCLVQKISSGDYFAMKILDQEKTVEKEQEENVQREVEIMKNLNTDYVVKLYYSFKNETHLFFVMDYMNGGDLGSLLASLGQLDEIVKFINNSLVCQILHS
jgi:serine/threonine protein kinase